MNDVDRWIHSEGPEPKGIRELMDAARRTPELPAGDAERLKRSIRRAVAEQRRADERKRWRRPAVWAALAFAAALGAIMLWLWLSPTGQEVVASLFKPSAPAPHPSSRGRARDILTARPSINGAEPSLNGAAPPIQRPKK
jgi:hypothetical protein